jgi:hypothetical protein
MRTLAALRRVHRLPEQRSLAPFTSLNGGFPTRRLLLSSQQRLPSLLKTGVNGQNQATINKCSRSLSSVAAPASTGSLIKDDFFGEQITFLGPDSKNLDASIAAYDSFLLTVLTRGKSTTGGGNEEGLQIKSAHAAAISWAELLEVEDASAPMMAVAAVGPILVQADVTYVRKVDELLRSTSTPHIQLMDLAIKAVASKDDDQLTQREQNHLEALHFLLQHDRQEALQAYLSILQKCPGDALALSFALDLASVLGNKDAAIRAATSVYSYWSDRQSVISGSSIGASLIAVGLAVGGRFAAAEGLIQSSVYHTIDVEGCGGLMSWAMAHVLDAEGRTAEGITTLNTYDGVQKFQSAGLLFFESRLSGYGARFALDREGAGDGRSILRVYDSAFERVFEYSGYAQRQPFTKTVRRAPYSRSRRFVQPAESLFQSLFGGSSAAKEEKDELTKAEDAAAATAAALPVAVDTLTWLPPTPQLLSDATFLLLRITLHGAIDGEDHRWQRLQNAWLSLLEQYDGDISSLPESAKVAASLACHDVYPSMAEEGGTMNNALAGARHFGRLMWLGGSLPSEEASSDEWKQAVVLLSKSEDYKCWDIDARPLFEIGLCHAACMTDRDLESLSIARSICSRGVALRTNSPEEWFRYSTILDRLGDDIAADQARAASISMGAGEGGSGAH